MRETNLEYIGQIPNSWNLVHLGRLTSEVRLLNSDCTESNALQFKMGSIISKSIGDSKYQPETLEGYTVLQPGDVVVNGLNLNYDLKSLRVGQVKEKGVITSAYISIHPESINPSFLNYLLKGFDSIKTFHGMGKGIRLTLSYEELRRMYIPVPSLPEQSRIASFLDDRCAKIDEAIKRCKEMNEKLDEYRKAVITKAVTKGVLTPLKHIVSYNNDSLSESTLPDYNFDYVDISSVSYEYGIESKERISFGTAPSRARRIVSQGDVIVSTVRTYLKAIAQIPEIDYPLIVSTGFCVLTAQNNISPDFLGYALKSETFIYDVEMNSYGISYPAINSSALVNLKIPVPSPSKQAEIVIYLDKRCAEIDTAKEKNEAIVKKLEEYKKSLIYHAVTGKIEC